MVVRDDRERNSMEIVVLVVVEASNLEHKRDSGLESDTTDVVLLPSLAALDRAMLVKDTSDESKHRSFENCPNERERSKLTGAEL